MESVDEALKKIDSGGYDNILSDLYGCEKLSYQRQRIVSALNLYERYFGTERKISLFSAPGRMEISGNHTDHQWGNVLSASVDLDTIGIVSPNNDGVIRVKSNGFPIDEIAVSLKIKGDPREYSPLGDFVIADLDPYPNEIHKSIALIRGITAKFYLMGKELGGFDCYTTSNIIHGAGLSSSAAFEVLIGCIMNYLFMDNSVSPEEIAQIGQFAENYYYKKPCGLMDQLTSAVGGIIWIDFYDSDTPFVKKVNYDFSKSGYTICMLDSGGTDNDNVREYETITREMKSVANFFGKTALSRLDEDEFLAYIGDVRKKCGDRAVLRAWHFFNEDKRAIRCAELLNKNDFQKFLREVDNSGKSSFMYLQNVFDPSDVNYQPLSVVLAHCGRILDGEGAFRVHGGGFGGTVQAYVPDDMVGYFKRESEKLLGDGRCHILKIRRHGCAEIGGSYE